MYKYLSLKVSLKSLYQMKMIKTVSETGAEIDLEFCLELPIEKNKQENL